MATTRPTRQFICAAPNCGKIESGVGRVDAYGDGPFCFGCRDSFIFPRNKEDLGEPDGQFDVERGSVVEARGRARMNYGQVPSPKSVASDRTRSPRRAPVRMGQNDYEVEYIKCERVGTNGATEYLVSWTGCDSHADSWLGATNIGDGALERYQDRRAHGGARPQLEEMDDCSDEEGEGDEDDEMAEGDDEDDEQSSEEELEEDIDDWFEEINDQPVEEQDSEEVLSEHSEYQPWEDRVEMLPNAASMTRVGKERRVRKWVNSIYQPTTFDAVGAINAAFDEGDTTDDENASSRREGGKVSDWLYGSA